MKFEKQIKDGWNHLWNSFFIPETSLFYDYLSSRDFEHRFDHLPYPDEIAASFPNACGWGAGMEDCMLNAGSLMDILALRKKASGENNLEQAVRILRGIYNCTVQHENPGFIVRGISPRDGKSCYPNSSRDQFTLAIYGAWRFLKNYPEAEPEDRTRAEQILLQTAEFCKKRITRENNWDLGALDGGPAIVSKMWECDIHEVLRLPMIYIAAYSVSGDDNWKREADRYFKEGLAISLKLDPRKYWWDIPLMQMQISLQLLLESNCYPESENDLREAMTLAGTSAQREISVLFKNAEQFHGDWIPIHGNWHFADFKLPWIISNGGDRTLFRGKPFLSATYANGDYAASSALIRGIGNYGIAQALAGKTLPESELKILENLFHKIDFERICSGAIIQLFHFEYLRNRK